MTRSIEPREVGWAGALQIARVDRQIGAQGQRTHTWLIASRDQAHLTQGQWLELEQTRWGIENRSHHTLDVTHREDESRVHHPDAATVLGTFRRLSNAFKQNWAKDRPKREATSRDWFEENHFDRWKAIRLITLPTPEQKSPPISPSRPRPHCPFRV